MNILQIADLKKLKGQVFALDTETELPKTPGAYCIICGKVVYVGGCSNLRGRNKTHHNALKAGTHANPALQAQFNEVGKYEFVVLEHVADRAQVAEVEQKWLRTFIFQVGNLANVNGVHERSAETRKKISEHHKAAGIRPPSTKGIPRPKMLGNQHAKGHTDSREARVKKSKAGLGNQHAKGHVHSPEQREKIAEASRKMWAKRKEEK